MVDFRERTRIFRDLREWVPVMCVVHLPCIRTDNPVSFPRARTVKAANFMKQIPLVLYQISVIHRQARFCPRVPVHKSRY